jgi:Ca-activated chloride channel family protein
MRAFGIALLLLIIAVPAHAESAASKNRQGNQFFQRGKFQDAERAYLEAQAAMPERPEIAYNLGNSLIKQKKYEQALQSLRSSVSQGSKELQARSWYNVGNALYDMGRYKDSAQSYIQALHLNPADRDTKHNLELALKKMQEQKQEKPQQSQDPNQQPDKQEPEEGQSDAQGKNDPKPQDKQGQPQQNQKEQKPADPRASKADRPEGAFSRERALQILDALQNQELAEQRKILERLARRIATGRDW